MLQYRSTIQNHHKIVHIHRPFITHSSFIHRHLSKWMNHSSEDIANPKKVYLRSRFKLITNNSKKVWNHKNFFTRKILKFRTMR